MKVASFYASLKKSCVWFDFVLWCKISFIVPSLSFTFPSLLSLFPPSFPPSPFLLPPSFLSFSPLFPFLFCSLRWNACGVSWIMTSQIRPSHKPWNLYCCCAVTKSCLTLRPWGLQCARRPCPSLSPRVCSNSCPLSWWNQLFLCCPLLLLLSIFPIIEVFSNESVLRIRWPNYWSFPFSISPSNEYSGLISFRTDWFDLLAVQQTLKSLLQHHSLNWYYLIW